MIKLRSTPVELYDVHGVPVYVKREDLATPEPGPPFSKVRGLVPVLRRLKREGYTTIGYTETSVSMAGWGVAWACAELGLTAVLYDPQYKETPELLAFHRERWREFGAVIEPIKAGMARVNYNICKKHLRENYKRSYMLPLGLPFPETVKGAREEALYTRSANLVDYRTIIVNIGSGTIAAGVVEAFNDCTVYGIMGRTGDKVRKRRSIAQKGGFLIDGLMGVDFRIVDPGWEYTQKSEAPCPFPCHPWYDLKAWQWLVENVEHLEQPILFWNIGREV